MLAVIKDGGIDRYDDLHIDRIDSDWREPHAWIPAGLHAFDLALNIRDQQGLPFSVVLGFSLKSGIQRRGVNFGSPTEIEREFAETPPSLYLFRRGQEPWVRAGLDSSADNDREVIVERIEPAILGEAVRAKGCFYFEFGTKHEEYSRSILLAG